MEQHTPICRTCLAEASSSIFKTVLYDEEELSLVEILTECIGIKVTESDEISLNICDVCTKELVKFYEYRKKCWNSQNILYQRLEESKIDPLKLEVLSDSDVDYESDYCLEKEDEGPENSEFCIESVSNKNESTFQYNILVDKTLKSRNAVKCQLCNKIYSRKDVFLRHLRSVHNILELHQFECKHCNKSFRRLSNLGLHITKFHQNKNLVEVVKSATYMCHHCGLKLKNQRSLTEHVRRHTGEKPYKCNLCEYRAVQRYSINTHMRTHTGERPFECNICGKLFRTSSARANHRHSHSEEKPYECIVCSKKFKQKDVFKEHMIIHDPDKYIACKFCGKKFARKDNLKTHIKQHTGEKPHVCEVCGKGFIQRHCWRNHMTNHHNQ